MTKHNSMLYVLINYDGAKDNHQIEAVIEKDKLLPFLSNETNLSKKLKKKAINVLSQKKQAIINCKQNGNKCTILIEKINTIKTKDIDVSTVYHESQSIDNYEYNYEDYFDYVYPPWADYEC